MGMITLVGVGKNSTSPPPPPAALLLDRFTDTNGVDLAVHTMDIGSGWTILTGAVLIQSNKGDSSSTTDNTFARAVADAGQADVTLTCDVTTLGVGAGDGGSGVILRATDNNNLWYLDVVPGTGGSGQFRLVERNSGTDTVRASSTPDIINATAYAFAAVLSGTTMTATLDGSNSITFSSSFNATATKFGLNGRKHVGIAAGTKFDNFQVTA